MFSKLHMPLVCRPPNRSLAGNSLAAVQHPAKSHRAGSKTNPNPKTDFVKINQIQRKISKNQPNPKVDFQKPTKSKSPNEKNNQIQHSETQTKDRAWH